jgi:hypothetical protein
VHVLLVLASHGEEGKGRNQPGQAFGLELQVPSPDTASRPELPSARVAGADGAGTGDAAKDAYQTVTRPRRRQRVRLRHRRSGVRFRPLFRPSLSRRAFQVGQEGMDAAAERANSSTPARGFRR